MKRPRNDVCDLVIRTRRQKANPPSRNQHSFTDGSESAVDTSIVGDRNITNGSDESGHPLSPPMRPSLLPDGSPRRISIMNWSHRFPFSEFYNGKVFIVIVEVIAAIIIRFKLVEVIVK